MAENVARGPLAELLEKWFEKVEAAGEEYMVFFTRSTRCTSYIFGAYGVKSNVESEVKYLFKEVECMFNGMATDVIRTVITNARDYFKATGKARVKSHFPQDDHNEDVLMLCTNNFTFDTCAHREDEVVPKQLAQLLNDRFELVVDMREQYLVFFTYDYNFESIIFGNYGLKANTEKKIAELFQGLDAMEKSMQIANARAYFESKGVCMCKAHYPVPQDFDSSCNREEVLVLASPNFAFDEE